MDIPIIINDDAYWEGSTNETVKITAIAGNNAQSGGPLDWTYTIIENETKPELRFKLYNSEVTSLEEDADVNRDVEVELSGLSTEAVNFTYSITSTNAGTGDNAYLTNSTDDDNDGSQDETGGRCL